MLKHKNNHNKQYVYSSTLRNEIECWLEFHFDNWLFFFLGKWQNLPGTLLEYLDFFYLTHYVLDGVFVFENIWMLNFNEIFHTHFSEDHVYRIEAYTTSLIIKRNLGQ